MDSEYTKDAILELLKDKNSLERRNAIKIIEKQGDKTFIPVLLEMLRKDESPYVRRAIAAAFQGKLGDKSAVPVLINSLKDDNLYVRGAAASALGKIKDPRAVVFLCKALKDEEPHVRWAAAFPLGEIKDASALPALRELINNPEELSFVKHAALTAIKQLENNNQSCI